jgi:hypothetical protein
LQAPLADLEQAARDAGLGDLVTGYDPADGQLDRAGGDQTVENANRDVALSLREGTLFRKICDQLAQAVAERLDRLDVKPMQDKDLLQAFKLTLAIQLRLLEQQRPAQPEEIPGPEAYLAGLPVDRRRQVLKDLREQRRADLAGLDARIDSLDVVEAEEV